MELWIALFLPFTLILARVSGFIAVLPVFSSPALPLRVRAGVVMLLTIFLATTTPPPAGALNVPPLAAAILLVEEVLCGLAMGLAARFVFMAVQQGARIADRQMGFATASIIDPTTGQVVQPVGMMFQMVFTFFFLAVGGLQLLLRIIVGSYKVFPVGSTPEIAVLAGGLVKAGSAMLLFALQFAAPLLAAFLVLSVVLAILARVLPEMNVLMASLPLRVGLGLLMAAAIMPTLKSFTAELAIWMNKHLVN